MKTTHQHAAVLGCAVLLGVGFVSAVETVAATGADQFTRTLVGQRDQQNTDNMPAQGKVVKGEVLRVQGDTWFIKDEGGKEVQLHVDETTRRSPQKLNDKDMKGVAIEAMINDRNHALSISSPDRRDDRHDHSMTP